jgi:metal iron transporter
MISQVIAVDVCFAIQIGKINPPAVPVLRGYVPSKTLFSKDGAYAAVGILGATVMPHR